MMQNHFGIRDNTMKKDKNSMPIDDSDGKLHLYCMVAFGGKRWGMQHVFEKEEMTPKEVERCGWLLVNSAMRRLVKEKIIPKP